jgi:hypothetical protein
MGQLMKRIEDAAKSPKAKSLEKQMIRKAKDPQTIAKISKGFKKFAKKNSRYSPAPAGRGHQCLMASTGVTPRRPVRVSP